MWQVKIQAHFHVPPAVVVFLLEALKRKFKISSMPSLLAFPLNRSFVEQT